MQQTTDTRILRLHNLAISPPASNSWRQRTNCLTSNRVGATSALIDRWFLESFRPQERHRVYKILRRRPRCLPCVIDCFLTSSKGKKRSQETVDCATFVTSLKCAGNRLTTQEGLMRNMDQLFARLSQFSAVKTSFQLGYRLTSIL